jgi:hypothetical protein
MVCIRSKLTLDLTEDDWKIYLDTVKAAMTKKDSKTGKTLWETANEKHAQVSALHSMDWFTYLHRYFLVWFERQLQEINPNFSFFYWDTAKENAGWPKSKIWGKLGGCKGRVSIENLGNYEVRRDCRTSAILYPPEYYAVLYTKTKGNGYHDYSKEINLAHAQVHLTIGGYMADITKSPLDPLFYAHHCNIDYIAFRNQLQWFDDGFPRDYSYKPLNPKSELPGFPGIKLEDVLDLVDLCISYAPPRSGNTRNNTSPPLPGNGTSISGQNPKSGDKNITNPLLPGKGTPNKNITDPLPPGGKNITDPSIPEQVINSTTVELSDEWLKSSFGRETANEMQRTFNETVENGTVIITKVVVDDKYRNYVGVKKDGEKTLKRLSENSASSIQLGVFGFIILSTLFL